MPVSFCHTSNYRIIIVHFYFPIKFTILPHYIFFQVLSHSWEWIQRNKNIGLMALSEEALESKQKSARNIRKFRCFQGDVLKNLVQAHQTMQLESDMFLNKPYESSNCNVS